MSTGTTKQPNLPLAPLNYDRQFIDDLLRILRLYFAELDNPGISQFSTNYRDGKILSALNCSTINSLGVQVISLPNQADVAKLRAGDIYVDLTAGNVLKIKL
jgi:hypothetical protein